jgi:hypothetical protein
MCKFIGTIPLEQLQYAEVLSWDNIQTPLPKNTWNTEGKTRLNACNRNWLEDLAKEISEALCLALLKYGYYQRPP